MRAVHIIKVTGMAGAEQHLLLLLAGLRARAVDAHLLLLVEPARPVDEMAAAAEARSIPTERLVIHSNRDLLLGWRLWRRLRALRPDLVHTHLLHADLFGIPAARLARVPVVLSGRHNDNAFRSRPLMRRLNRWLWGRVTGGVAISQHLAHFAATVEGAPPQKLYVIPYGIDHTPYDDKQAAARRRALRDELGLPAGAVLVGMVSRLVEQKGVIHGLRAFARLAPFFPELHLVIAGDGPQRENLTQAAAELPPGRVHFLGWRTDAQDVIGALDLFLMPSLWEGFGMTLLEAMSARVPVVASRVSAIPEIVLHGQTGLLVPPRDVGGLARAMYNLLVDESLRRHMGLLAEDRLEAHFSAARMVEQTCKLYEELRAST